MIIRFGNLTVREFAAAVDADFTDAEVEALEGYRTEIASFTDKTKFHIFKDPLSIVIGSDAIGPAGDIFKAANARKVFGRAVTFYPASAS